MKRWIGAWLAITSTAVLLAQEPELPVAGGTELPLEIEPPLLIQNRGPESPLPDASPSSPATPDIVKIEKDLARAKRNAGSADRMFRAGIIAKVEAEERLLKVVRLEAKLAEARLNEAKSKAEVQKAESVVQIEAQLRAGNDQVAEAERLAQEAAKERQKAELEAAFRNLQRQQKLLALGSGRKADVNRAEQKLAELQRASN